VETQHCRMAESDYRPGDALIQPSVEEFGANGNDAQAVIRFRRFHVAPSARLLLYDGRPVDIGSRAFDLLIVLLRSRGVLVTKDEIVSQVWPSTVVDESNLRFQIGSLRKTLGEDRDIIKTVPGRGYLFAAEVGMGWATLRMPITAAPTISGSAPGPQRLGGAPGTLRGTSKATVAIIDDDCGTREALEGLLRSVGLQVESFSSVQAFLDRARSSPPDCLVLDVWLPGRSGLDFQADLTEAGLHLPVIFISGHADVRMCVRAMKAGAFEFLTKPVRHQDLLDAIQLALTPGLGVIAHSGASTSP
jgi:DNA-binding response OmpR family regulator